MTAPATPGQYDAGFTARAANDCTGTASAEFTLPQAVRVTQPAPNPNLTPRCGVDVMLVLDESGSIASSGATEKVRNATRAFLNGLSGTGSRVSIIDFSTSAGRPIGYTTVTPTSIAGVFEPYLVNGYQPSGFTNWEDALRLAQQANAGGPVADMVVFITDGDPTARNNPGGTPNPITDLPDGDYLALTRASNEADLVKGQGSHVMAIGVGAAVTDSASATRLTAISGPNRIPPADLATGDYTLVQSFDDLAAALAELATGLCQASVSVTKLVDNIDGKGFLPAAGWTFRTTVSMSSGSFTWLQPAPPPDTGQRSATTGADGVAKFQWKPSDATAGSTVTVNETAKDGYQLVDATCVVSGTAATARRRKVRRITRAAGIPPVTLAPGQYATCTVRNKRASGTIEVRKVLQPATDGARFDLLVDGAAKATSVGDGGTTGALEVLVGTRQVAERLTAAVQSGGVVTLADYVTTVACRDQNGTGTVVASGSGAGPLDVPVSQGAQIVCVFTNQRPGAIQITKDAVPNSAQAFAFTGSLGPFSLIDDGSPTNQRTFTGLAPGPFAVTETVPAGWTLAGIACSDPSAVVTGASVAVTLDPGEVVACTFRNGENAVPPTPPTPPPPDDGGVGGVTPPTPPPSTQIHVDKRCPATAALGQIVTCTLTVTNVGNVPAKGVRVRDYPPARIELALIRSNAKPRIAGGTAGWDIGTLAPGASRTIRVSVRVETAQPGTVRNLVIASATNAKQASDISNTLVSAVPARARVPAVTG